MRFFFYGTLLDADIRRVVLGRSARGLTVEPATLGGYRRVCLRRRTYPAVVPDPLGSVPGCLARGLDAGAGERLAAFEGEEYEPVLCEVSTGLGPTLPAWVFVAGAAAVLSTVPWDFETWRRRHKRACQRRLRRDAGGLHMATVVQDPPKHEFPPASPPSHGGQGIMQPNEDHPACLREAEASLRRRQVGGRVNGCPSKYYFDGARERDGEIPREWKMR